MNQRNKRASERKQNINGSTMATGGYVVKHSPNEEPEVRVPQKATGDVKPQGLAKASPFFKKLEDAIKPETPEKEKKIIAEATIKEDKK